MFIITQKTVRLEEVKQWFQIKGDVYLELTLFALKIMPVYLLTVLSIFIEKVDAL